MNSIIIIIIVLQCPFTGARFAICQSKIGLIKILRNHKVDVCEKTIIPHEYDPGAFLLTPKHGVYVKLTKLES